MKKIHFGHSDNEGGGLERGEGKGGGSGFSYIYLNLT